MQRYTLQDPHQNEPMPTRRHLLTPLLAAVLATGVTAQTPRATPHHPEAEQADSALGRAFRDLAQLEDGVTAVRLAVRPPRAVAPGAFVLLDSVPAGMRLVGASAFIDRPDASVAYSVDGGRTFASSPMESVEVNGAPVRRLVSPDRVTHIRFAVAGALPAGSEIRAEYRLRPAAPRVEAVAGR